MADHYLETIEAVKKLYEKHGDGYEFTADEIWPLTPSNSSIIPNAKGSLTRNLVKDKYIMETGRSKVASSQGRRSNASKAYTFGIALSENSLELILAQNGRGMSPRSSEYSEQLPNNGGVYPLGLPLQRIIHGCPGSGKSFLLESDSQKAHYVIRTVFHPETRYSDFVGGLRPESIYRIM